MRTDVTTYYTNQINYTSQASDRTFKRFTTPYNRNTIVLFMTSLWIRATFGVFTKSPVQLHVYNGVINESFYFWNITLRTGVLVTNVHFSQVIFNS